MVDLRRFLAADGISIRYRRLFGVLFGAGVLAYFRGVAATILAAVDVPLSLLSGLATFLGQYYSLLVGLPAVVVQRGFAAAIPYVTNSGIAGFLVAVTIALLTFAPIAVVVSRVG